MGLERKPRGWFVRKTLHHDGRVQFEVLKMVKDADWAGEREHVKDTSEMIAPDNPWWLRLVPKMTPELRFQRRIQQAAERAQRRAWTLNNQFAMAKRYTYDLEVKARKQRTNPHDD